MEMTKAIRIAMAKKGIKSDSELARLVGWTPQNFHNKLNRDNFSTKELSLLADAMGCTLSIEFRDKETGETV